MKKIIILISLFIILVSSCKTLNVTVPDNLRSMLVKNMKEEKFLKRSNRYLTAGFGLFPTCKASGIFLSTVAVFV